MPKYQPSFRLVKHPKLDVSTDSSTSTVPNPNMHPSVLTTAAMEPLMLHSGFQPSSKLTMCPKLNKSMVASTFTLPETLVPSALPIAVTGPPLVYPQFQEGSVEAIVPASHFYGVPAFASPFGGYFQDGKDRHVRFKNPLVEGTPLHI